MQIDQYTEIRVGLSNESFQLIPYRAEGDVYPYYSLIKNPEAIEKIPELFHDEKMKDFIRQINSSKGIFETVRVACNEEPELIDGCSKFRRFLSVGYIFRDRSFFSNYPNCLMVVGNLLMWIQSNDIHYNEPFIFDIQSSLIVNEGNIKGWIMDLLISGVANDKNAASKNLDNILEKLTPFFLSADTTDKP